MSRLLFSPDGSLLLHCFHKNKRYWDVTDSALPNTFDTLTTQVWDVDGARLRFTVAGYPIGVSDDGSSFITERAVSVFSVWDSSSGAELSHVAPTNYAQSQRIFLDKPTPDERDNAPALADPKRGGWTLIRDVFGVMSPQWFEINDPVTNILVSTHVFIACWFDFGDIDGAYGQAIALDSGKVTFTFSVNRHAPYIPLHCSAVHERLFVGGDPLSGFVAVDLETGKADKSEFATGVCKLFQQTRGKTEGAAFHPDGERLALSVGQQVIDLWHVSRLEKLQKLSRSAS